VPSKPENYTTNSDVAQISLGPLAVNHNPTLPILDPVISVHFDDVNQEPVEMSNAQKGKIYCIYNDTASGEMIGCDILNCSMERLQFKCVNITRAPRGKWHCNI
jgi:hypothetical protein